MEGGVGELVQDVLDGVGPVVEAGQQVLGLRQLQQGRVQLVVLKVLYTNNYITSNNHIPKGVLTLNKVLYPSRNVVV